MFKPTLTCIPSWVRSLIRRAMAAAGTPTGMKQPSPICFERQHMQHGAKNSTAQPEKKNGTVKFLCCMEIVSKWSPKNMKYFILLSFFSYISLCKYIVRSIDERNISFHGTIFKAFSLDFINKVCSNEGVQKQLLDTPLPWQM